MNSSTHVLQSPRMNRWFNRGFTIVELVVTIAVIGILLALTVVSYGSWRERVARSEVNSDLLNIQAAMEDARNRDEGYPVFTINTVFDGTNSTRALFTQSKNVTVTYKSGSATDYCITAVSKEKSTVAMFVDISYSLKPISGTPWVGVC